MSEPADYQSPLPDGRSLRFWQTPDAVRVSRDTVTRYRLWKEALLPVVVIVFTVLCEGLCIWRIMHPARIPVAGVALVFVPIMAVILSMFAYSMRGFWQNSGVVTEISVTQQTLYWRKETIFGSREYFWPLSDVKWVEVDRLSRMLKVLRKRGVALGAFAVHRIDELENAAALLNDAIQLYRDGPTVGSDGQRVQY